MLNTHPLHNVAGLILACSALNAAAAPGDLDTTFGTGGKFQTPVGGTYGGSLGGVIVQSDGRIFLAGEVWNDVSNDYDFTLVRLTEDGELDTSFDTDGKITFPMGPRNDSAYDIAIAPADDSFVVVGSAGSTNFTTSEFAVARFNSDGTPDTGFNTTGKALVSVLSSARNEANDALILADGKVLVAGSAYYGGSPRIGLVRFNENGSLDTDFDGDGKAVIDPGNEAQGIAVCVQPDDGKIVVVGSYYNGNNQDFLVVRCDSSGVLDTSFGGDGIVTTPIFRSDTAQAVVVQADGKIIAAGSANDFDANDFALVRYNTDGSLDTTFGGDGIVTTDFGSYDAIYSLKIDAEGRIVAAGTANNATDGDFAIARYLDDGTLDTTFGDGGKVMSPIGAEGDNFDDMAIQDDGKILLAGDIETTGANQFAAARYLGEPEVVEPTRKADVRLGAGSALGTGNNVYNLTGKKQTESLKIVSGKTRTMNIGIQNDGTAVDSFKLQGTAGNKDFSITYQAGSKDVTDAVTAGKFKTGALDPGETLTLKAKIKAKTEKAGKEKSFALLASSIAKPKVQDKAIIEVKSKDAD
jgi:uncharacterized delta-60 repeat protein